MLLLDVLTKMAPNALCERHCCAFFAYTHTLTKEVKEKMTSENFRVLGFGFISFFFFFTTLRCFVQFVIKINITRNLAYLNYLVKVPIESSLRKNK